MHKLFNPLILIILLSAFVHLWNATGTPEVDSDEGHYIRRAIIVMLGGGAQEPKVPEPNPTYGNPFFGQVFLGSLLTLSNYPYSLHFDENINTKSIEALFLSPRVIMGVLAIANTFLLYKIAERRYNTKIAIAASILFAVMPFSLDIRRVFLETLQMPLILLSILFALYHNNYRTANNIVVTNERSLNAKTISILISGIFLGLAIFTKITAFNIIPLVGFLIYSNSKNKGFKALGLWIIPIIAIPCIWPAYAILSGDFDKWIGGIDYQTNREGIGILSIRSLFQIDPILIALGITGTVFALAKRKDFFPLLWISPFLIFFSIIGIVRSHNYIPLLPVFCLAGGILIIEIYQLFRIHNVSAQRLVFPVILGAIVISGMMSTAPELVENQNSTFFNLYSFLVLKLQMLNDDNNANDTDRVTVIGRNWMVSSLSWIPNYVYHNDHDFRTYTSKSKIQTEKVIFVVDKHMRNLMSNTTKEGERYVQRQLQAKKLYDASDIIERFNFTTKGIFSEGTKGRIEIRGNY